MTRKFKYDTWGIVIRCKEFPTFILISTHSSEDVAKAEVDESMLDKNKWEHRVVKCTVSFEVEE